MATNVRLSLVDGPSKFGLMLALFDPIHSNSYSDSGDHRVFMGENMGRLVAFTYDSGEDQFLLQIFICGLERKDPFGSDWKFLGQVAYTAERTIPRGSVVEGEFSVRTRKGSAEVTVGA